MKLSELTRADRDVAGDVVTPVDRLLSDDRVWLGLSIAAAAAVYVIYLVTHPYPAYGAGLYLRAVEAVLDNGYRLPARIPHYTDGGVPFAYPPLAFYLVAVLRDLTGADPVTISRLLPGIVVIAYVVPYYLLARAVLGSPPRAGLATVMFATAPPVLQWHLSAGGIVRAVAFLLAVTGVYAGWRLFADRDRRWLVPATALFGLTVLAHPTYAVFFGVSYLVVYAAFDRSAVGLLAGAVVALGGVALAAPWWVTVVRLHGVDVFVAASTTHSGLGGGLGRLLDQFAYPLKPNVTAALFLSVWAGGLYLLAEHRPFLPGWLLASAYFLGKVRFQFVAGAMILALAVFEGVLPTIRRRAAKVASPRALSLVTVFGIAIALVGIGALSAAGAVGAASGAPAQPAFVDDADREAMAWAAATTAPSARFVVLGDAGEWFPLFAERTSLVGPWGAEWTTAGRYEAQLQLHTDLSTCRSDRCLTHYLRDADGRPDYVYVPKGEYTVRGIAYAQSDYMRSSLLRSDRYDLVFENEGVVIVRVADG